MKISKTIAVLYVLIVAYLTIQYFIINGKNMSEPYALILFISSILNISMLAIYCIFPRSKKTETAVSISILTVMIISSFLKAFFHRSVPGVELTDFAGYPKFNEHWNFIQKFLWHFTLDLIVFGMVWLFKNSYRLFQQRKT